MRRWAVPALLAAAASACAVAQEAQSPAGKSAGGIEARAEGAASEPQTRAGGGEVEAGLGGVPLPGIRPSVIKTAQLELEVGRGELRDALREATGIAGTYGGFVLSSTVRGPEARRGALVIRVPAERFELALADVHGLGAVKRETVSGVEVGQEFVDLEARLRNLEGQEAVLLGLYGRAATIPESIRVQSEVAAVQLRIEEIQGRLGYLRDQAALGTISLDLREKGAAPPSPSGAIERAWERAVDASTAIVSAVIVGLGFALPFLALAALAYPLLRRVRPRPAP